MDKIQRKISKKLLGLRSQSWQDITGLVSCVARQLASYTKPDKRQLAVIQGGSGTWDGGAAGTADEPEIPAKDWYKVAMFCTSPEFPEDRSP